LNIEICPEETLGDFDMFVYVDCRSEIRFALSPKLSEEQAHSELKALTVAWFKGAVRQTTLKKAYSSLSITKF